MYALLGVAMVTMLAIVIDLASLRQDRRADRSMADTAVAAGAVEIDPADPSTFTRACVAAWDYLVANRPDAGGTMTAPDCASTFPPTAPCDSSTPTRTATATIGTATVEISHPVRNGSPLMLAETQGGDRAQTLAPSVDGVPCQRIGVRVVRTRALAFAAIAGLATGRTDVHSVARPVNAPTTRTPGVVALESNGCDGLVVSPNGVSLLVAGSGQGGYVIADSSAAACAGFVIDAQDPGRIQVDPNGASQAVIESYASALGSPAAYDPTDVATGRLTPVPAARPAPIRRTFIDDRYLAEVTLLQASLGPAAGSPPPAYQGLSFSTYAEPAFPCAVAGDVVVPAGNWFVDCPLLVVDGRISFAGGVIVLAGGVEIHDTGCFAIGSAACGGAAGSQDSIAFLRSGDFVKAEKGSLHLMRTMLFLTGGLTSTDGRLLIGPDFSGGATQLIWTSPLSGDFEDLVLWAESGADMAVGGQGATVVEGTAFAPNARLTLVPRPGGTAVSLQAVADRVYVDGNSQLLVRPTPSRATGTLVRSARLIR